MVIELKQVGLQRNQQDILQGIHGAFERGKIYALLGPNGAGKSTLLKALAQLLPFSCQISIAGKDSTQFSPESLARQLAYLPQHSQLQFPLTVREVLSLATLPFDVGLLQQRQQVNKAIGLWGIESLKDKDFRQLSGGEQQRCQLARTFIQVSNCAAGGVWLLDEPTSSLDLEHQQQLQQICQQVAAAGHCLILVLHDLNMAMRLADSVWVLDEGQLVANGDSHQVLNESLIKKVFKVNASAVQDKAGNKVFVYHTE